MPYEYSVAILRIYPTGKQNKKTKCYWEKKMCMSLDVVYAIINKFEYYHSAMLICIVLGADSYR